jgi:hypothetical protein
VPENRETMSIQALYVSMCGRQWKGDYDRFPKEINARLRSVQIDHYVMDGSTAEDPSHFYNNPEYFRKENGTGSPKEYDVIVYTGHDGSSYEAAKDVDALVKAHNGVHGAKPAMFLRCSHFFAQGYYDAYREILGLGSMSHEPEQPEGAYRFPNPTDPCVEGVDTSEQYAPDNVCTNTYYSNGGVYGRNLVSLIEVRKEGLVCPVAWKYEYSNQFGGAGARPRMFAHTYDMSSGGGSAPFTSTVWDVIARSLVWVAGQENASYLRR